MTLVSTGSISTYVAQHADLPVAVVRYNPCLEARLLDEVTRFSPLLLAASMIPSRIG